MKYSPLYSFEDRLRAPLGDLRDTLSANASSPISRGHGLAGPQRRQVERAEERDLAEPGGVERVGLGAFEHAVGVAVLADQILDRPA